MTRWKYEPRTTLLLMHAHNQWSQWNDALLSAADQLGLLVGHESYANFYDGSTDREWYMNTAQLSRVGGRRVVEALAYELRASMFRSE